MNSPSEFNSNMQNFIRDINQPGNQSPPAAIPPPHVGTGPFPPPSQPVRRRFSVNENFQEGHNLWSPGYGAYLTAHAGEVAEEIPNGNSNDHFVEAQIGDRSGYIPRQILTDN